MSALKVIPSCDSADSTGIIVLHSTSSFDLKTRVSSELTPNSPARMDHIAFRVEEAEEIAHSSEDEEETKSSPDATSPSFAAAGCMPYRRTEKRSSKKLPSWKQVANSAKKRISKLRKLFTSGSGASGSSDVDAGASGLIFDPSPERRKKELRALASYTSSRMKHTVLGRKEVASVGKIDPRRILLLEELFRKRDAPFPPSSSRVHVDRPVGALTPTRVEMVKAILKPASIPERRKPGSASSSSGSKSAFGLPRRKTDVSPAMKLSVEKAAKKIELARAKSTASTGSVGSENLELSERSISLGTILPPLLVPEGMVPDEIPGISEDENTDLNSELMMIAKESGLSPRDIIVEAVKEEIKEEEEAHLKFPDLDVLVDSALENAPELNVFCIDGNPLWEGLELEERMLVSKLLAEAIAFNEYFTEISFCNCGITDEFVEELCNWILKGKLKQLKILKFKGNMLGAIALSALCSVLEFKDSALEELHVGEQFPALSIDLEKMLARSIRANSSLLKVIGKFQSDEVREVVISSTKRNAAAKRSEDTVKFMTDIEKKVHRVINHQSACFADVDDQDEDASLEIEGDFAFTLLTTSEKIALAKSLKVNATLQVLRLVNVGLGDDFCIALAESLADNSCLHVLDLSGNSFTEIGFSALAAALSCNRSLKSVNLSGDISVSASAESDFLKCLEKNDKVISLELPKSISAGTLEASKKILSRNCFLKVKQWEMMSSPSIAKKGF